MDPKKQKIYIAIIVVCFLGTGGILYYGFGGGSSETPVNVDQNVIPVDNAPSSGVPVIGSASGAVLGAKSYPAPKVFPDNTKFDWTVLDSSKFQTLSEIPNLTLDPNQLGKDNLFTP